MALPRDRRAQAEGGTSMKRSTAMALWETERRVRRADLRRAIGRVARRLRTRPDAGSVVAAATSAGFPTAVRVLCLLYPLARPVKLTRPGGSLRGRVVGFSR